MGLGLEGTHLISAVRYSDCGRLTVELHPPVSESPAIYQIGLISNEG